MTTGPHGEKRPSNPVAHGVHIGRLATGEAEEEYVDQTKQRSGKQGGDARAAAMTAEQRREQAQRAAQARWDQE